VVNFSSTVAEIVVPYVAVPGVAGGSSSSSSKSREVVVLTLVLCAAGGAGSLQW